MIVVDSNVVAYLYLPGDYTEKAEALLEHDADWAAPLLWRSEFRNILAGYLRRIELDVGDAIEDGIATHGARYPQGPEHLKRPHLS